MSIGQNRLDYAPRGLQVSVTNGTDEPLTVTRASFDSALFDGTTEWTRRSQIPAGATRDLRVLLGAPVCDIAGPVDAPVATIEFETADGAVGTGSAEPADRFATVAKVSAADCLTEHTLEIASITTGDALRLEQRAGELVAMLDLTARPTGADGVVGVATVGRTTLVGPVDHSTGWNLGWAASAASGPQTTTLEIVPSNCNPHIVAEDKRGTYFPLAVTLEGGATGTVFVAVSDEVRGQIYGYIGAYCGW